LCLLARYAVSIGKELTTLLRNVRPLNLVLSSPRRGPHSEDGAILHFERSVTIY
jgi:hypothetical protein